MNAFTQVVLWTTPEGRSAFREEAIAFDDANPQFRCTPLQPAAGMQFRTSPVGFRSAMHWTQTPQWVFILSGAMEIGLADGSSRVFHAGEHFLSADTPPPGAVMDPTRHGHWSAQVGSEPLVTLFVRCAPTA